MKAQPMAASATAARMPPCTVPMGLPWASVASRTTTASPGEKDSSRMPRSVAAGGGGASPRTMRSMPSSSFAIAPAPRLGCPGRSLPPGIVLGPGPVVYAAKAQRPSLPSILVRHHALDRGGLVMKRWALVAAVLSALVVAVLPRSGHAQGKDTLVVALVRACAHPRSAHALRAGADSREREHVRLSLAPEHQARVRAFPRHLLEGGVGHAVGVQDPQGGALPQRRHPDRGRREVFVRSGARPQEEVAAVREYPGHQGRPRGRSRDHHDYHRQTLPSPPRAPHLLLHRAEEARGSGW